MAQPPSDYHRGEMDIQEQAATYDAFMAMTKWGSLILAVGTLFFTMLFCTGAGFMGSAATSVVLAVVGFLLLRGKPAH
jgi:hypothetical protein